MVDVVMPWASYFKGLVLANHWASDSRISSLTLPLLFISGQNDELVPPAQMKSLYDAAINARFKTFVTAT